MGGKGKKNKNQNQEYEMVEPGYAPPQGQQYNQNSQQYAQNQNEENNYDISQSSHPCAVVFQILFKVLAVIAYFFLGLFLDDAFQFIVITLLNCFDFWAVKNITGRLLIGMRWWSNFREDGTEYWVFESYNHNFRANIVDKSFFWTSQVLFTGFWLAFTILNTMTFSFYSLCLNIEGLLLAGCNLFGYYKCSKEHQNKMKNIRQNMAKEGFKYMAKQQFK